MNKVTFDYSKLEGKIREVCKTQMRFAEMLGCSNNTMSSKINNGSDFTQNEIIKSAEILGLKKSDIPVYFFTEQV